MGIRTLIPFLKSITEGSNLTNFNALVAAVDTSCWIHKVISLSNIPGSETIEGDIFVVFVLVLVSCALTSAYRRFFLFRPRAVSFFSKVL